MKRTTAILVSALLIIAQAVVIPAAWAATLDLGCDGCDDTGAAAVSHAGHHCSEHHPAPEGAGDGPAQRHPGAAGHCHCSHVSMHGQAVAIPMTALLLPVHPEALSGEPKGPAFSAPLFELLRPPR